MAFEENLTKENEELLFVKMYKDVETFCEHFKALTFNLFDVGNGKKSIFGILFCLKGGCCWKRNQH